MYKVVYNDVNEDHREVDTFSADNVKQKIGSVWKSQLFVEAGITASRNASDNDWLGRCSCFKTKKMGKDKEGNETVRPLGMPESWFTNKQFVEEDFVKIWGNAYEWSNEVGKYFNNFMYHLTRKSRWSAFFTVVVSLIQIFLIPYEMYSSIT
jgi:hypothetical protein